MTMTMTLAMTEKQDTCSLLITYSAILFNSLCIAWNIIKETLFAHPHKPCIISFLRRPDNLITWKLKMEICSNVYFLECINLGYILVFFIKWNTQIISVHIRLNFWYFHVALWLQGVSYWNVGLITALTIYKTCFLISVT